MKPFCVLCLLFLFGCTTQPPQPTITPSSVPTLASPTAPTATNLPISRPSGHPTNRLTDLPTIRPPDIPTNRPTDPILVGAGDIAVCDAQGDEATARLLDNLEGIVFTLGDNVYPNGSPEQFQKCYEPTWGRHKARTYPVPGNHDYNTGGAKGYYDYFGARAGDPKKGYYAYDVGAWRIIALNSEMDTGENSAQVQWLRDDLAQHPTQCALAMFHRPLFSSGPHGRDGGGEKTRVFWQVLYENNADVILNGHDHDYERFAPQDPNGKADAARGIREFVVGTGGGVPYAFGEIKPNSEARRAGRFGVLKLTLRATSYDWEFIAVTGALFGDSGRGECH
ncbi:MAG: metallophosphoesterase [Chloroflexi bacterium]|nr:metallophosphoesterase [Chloroflexota bacterium]